MPEGTALSSESRQDDRGIQSLRLIIVLLILVSISQAAVMPTFDFDEALYRRIAEEMKESRNYLIQTWDGKPFFEKPPTYVWTIIAADALTRHDTPHISILAARLPSLCFSILTCALLAWFWRLMAGRFAALFGIDGAVRGAAPALGQPRANLPQWLLAPATPVVAYAGGLLAFGGASSVLLDPMLTLFLLAPLLLFTAAFVDRGGRLTTPQMVIVAMGIAGAVAVKGLVGFILPAFALVLHSAAMAAGMRGSRRQQLREALRSLLHSVPAFALAFFLALAYFALLYRQAGSAFIYEFFVRQHFLRGAQAFQGHGGSIFYHPLVVLIFGGSLVGFLLICAETPRQRASFGSWGFPISWVVAVIVFYSAMSTKLPNYTWPVWPALTIALCILMIRAWSAWPLRAGLKPRPFVAALAYSSAAVIATAFLAMGLGMDRLAQRLPLAVRSREMLSFIEPLPLWIRASCLVIALSMAMQGVFLRDFRRRLLQHSPALWRSVAGSALMNALTISIASLVAMPFASSRMREPLIRLAALASHDHVPGGDLTTVGLFSPTLSSSYETGHPMQVGRATTALFLRPVQHQVIVPLWREQVCRMPGFSVVTRDEFLLLCEKRGGSGAVRTSSRRAVYPQSEPVRRRNHPWRHGRPAARFCQAVGTQCRRCSW
jgi:4-amino-4-deoxy-L-arabinose transferase-like glycosyltransferase